MDRVFYIFRHGETDWNKERRCQGHTNTNLNATGEEQARILARKFLDFPLEIIISSDLDRAFHTAKAVALLKNIPLLKDQRLREMSYGEAEGLLYEESIRRYGQEVWQKFQSFKKENDSIAFPGGETRKEARERFHAALLEILETHPYRHIGLSTHGGALRNILHSFLPEDHPTLPIPNCVVYKFEYQHIERKFIVDPNPI